MLQYAFLPFLLLDNAEKSINSSCYQPQKNIYARYYDAYSD